MEYIEKKRAENKNIAKGKSSTDCSFDEIVEIYRKTVGTAKTPEERLRRINAFRCGW